MAICDPPELTETGNGARTRVASWVAIVCVALLYAGLPPLLGAFSRSFLYGLYAGFVGCVFLCVIAEPKSLWRLRPYAPFMYWVVFYVVWGIVISTDEVYAAPRGGRLILRTAFILSAVAILLRERHHLTIFARWVGYAAVVNSALCVWETRNPALLQRLSTLSSQTLGVDAERPAGLWINPNLAAISFVFALLLSAWNRGLSAWLTRIASLVGAYLTVSRGGLVLVGVYLLAQATFLIRARTLRPRQLGVFLCTGWAVVVCAIVLGLVLLSHFDIPEVYAVQRFRLEGKPGEDKREILTRDALEAVSRGPWYGHGLFSFTGPAEGGDIRSAISPSQGSHNMYLTVWGETGIVGLVTYLCVLGLGLHCSFAAALSREDRQALVLMWIIFLLVGFIWHNVLENPFGVLYTALIYYLPYVLACNREPYHLSRIGAPHA